MHASATSDDPYPAGWAPSCLYYPVEVPGLLNNKDDVVTLVNEYESNATRDAWAQVEIYLAIATAFARVGHDEGAAEYLSKLAKFPWLHNMILMRPDLRRFADHPKLAPKSTQP